MNALTFSLALLLFVIALAVVALFVIECLAVLEQALKAAVEANSKLAEQITAQRKEIERLRSLTWV